MTFHAYPFTKDNGRLMYMSRSYENRYARRHRGVEKGYSGKSLVFILLCCALTVFLLSTSYLGDKQIGRAHV